MTIIISVLAISFVGAGMFFRRWWGGWEHSNHFVKLGVGFALAFIMGLVFLTQTSAVIAAGIIIGAGFLNPLHAYGQRMGNGGPSLLTSLAVMGGSYGAVTLIAAAAAYLLGESGWVLYFAPVGIIPALAYALSWWLFNRFFKNADGTFKKFWHTNDMVVGGVLTQEWFIDGPTAVGECVLGGCLIGGLPIIVALLQ